MATYNSQEIFSHYCEQSERLRNTKSEYKESPIDDLLLEAFYQNHVFTRTTQILLGTTTLHVRAADFITWILLSCLGQAWVHAFLF